jgi:hypothetical protein
MGAYRTAGMEAFAMLETLLYLVAVALLLLLALWIASRTLAPAADAIFDPPAGRIVLGVVGLILLALLVLGAAQRGLVPLSFLAPPVAAEVDWADDPAGSTCPCDSGGETRGEAEQGQDYPIPG